jgi:Ca2+-binding EF-hand superfamily protein
MVESEARFKMLDSNGDGAIAREEFKAYRDARLAKAKKKK